MSETGKVDNDLFINPSLYEKYTRDYGAIQPDDILITGVGTLGKVYVVKDGDKFYFKDGNIIWLKASGKVASKYVMQQFRFSLLLNQVFGTSAGSTVGTYTITNAKVTQIPLPPLPEQRAIAAALSDVDGYIAALERLIAKKRNIKQGAMQELLTGKRRLPGFRGEWIETTLGRIGEFSKGRGVSKAEAHSGKIPCIRYGEIYTIHNDFVKVFYSHISPAVAASSCQLSCGDLLFAGSGETKEEIGKCVAFVSNCEAYAGGDTIILTPFDNYDSLFLGYYLNSRKIVEQKASRGQGDAIVHIHIQSLSEIEVRLPATHEEQSAIAAILCDMDSEIDALTAKLNKVRNIKQGMMQELLTGRIRLVECGSVLPLSMRRQAAALQTEARYE